MPLKQLTKEGYTIFLGKLIDFEPSNYVYNHNMKFMNMAMDLWLYSTGTTKGHILLFDVQKVTLGYAARLSPMGLKKFLYYLQEGMPVRLKGLHFMNTTAAMDVILGMMKPFMKKELTDIVIKKLFLILIVQNQIVII